jgi:hypothetical protein
VSIKVAGINLRNWISQFEKEPAEYGIGHGRMHSREKMYQICLGAFFNVILCWSNDSRYDARHTKQEIYLTGYT